MFGVARDGNYYLVDFEYELEKEGTVMKCDNENDCDEYSPKCGTWKDCFMCKNREW